MSLVLALLILYYVLLLWPQEDEPNPENETIVVVECPECKLPEQSEIEKLQVDLEKLRTERDALKKDYDVLEKMYVYESLQLSICESYNQFLEIRMDEQGCTAEYK
jgi:hypothetical protein